VKKESKCFI